MLGRVTEKPQIWNVLPKVLLILIPIKSKMVFLVVLPSSSSETEVLPFCGSIIVQGKNNEFLTWEVFLG